MNVKILLYAAYSELEKAAKGFIKGSQLDAVVDVINRFAIYSAVASVVASVPGIGGVIAMLSQTGLVWGTYVMINKTLGISMKENVVKFIGSAMLTNLATNAASYLVAYIGASILTILPFGNVLSVALYGMMGYILIYASSVLYLNLLTKVMKAKGSFDLDDSDDTRKIIDNVVKNSDIKQIIKEGRETFKEKEKSGEFQDAIKNPKCPICRNSIKKDQKFCSNCGYKLK